MVLAGGNAAADLTKTFGCPPEPAVLKPEPRDCKAAEATDSESRGDVSAGVELPECPLDPPDAAETSMAAFEAGAGE